MSLDFDALVNETCLAAFGEDEPIVYTPPRGGASFPVRGVFQESYTALMPLGRGALEAIGTLPSATGAMPVLGVRLADFVVVPAQGGVVALKAGTYVVKEVQPDGLGWAKLLLNGAEE